MDLSMPRLTIRELDIATLFHLSFFSKPHDRLSQHIYGGVTPSQDNGPIRLVSSEGRKSENQVAYPLNPRAPSPVTPSKSPGATC